ncbi:hypothetical protein A2982_02775 [candidate division WWE3 bacterium RIFCSPLOWO2_01_FULL_39_13]|uniref:Protein-L-isoaspartate O-methyltransferase n=1 Tax=candidate division WWE3 bacterium RIFCSPLOWO2_01_FULL_39_13 TaxID=1802624 RepID=A0A1F4V2M3_UNCKA|nr:MAG: hypothetical protein A2982_02775 [candidate division WWE3 bacterium RIFCSPLOWO2_01_FULL_39_13]
MNNWDLISDLVDSGVLKSSQIIEAFKNVDRVDFVPDYFKEFPYVDAPLSIGYGQTISQPTTVAIMLELLHPQKGDHVLDIGSGSGWTTTLLAYIVGDSGKVAGKEIIPELVEFGSKNLAKYNFINATISTAVSTTPEISDPGSKTLDINNSQVQQPLWLIGTPGVLYDRILVSASAEKFPSELLGQLKNDGRLVIPVQNSIWLYKKDKKGEISKEEYPGFVFVPLK